MRSPDIPAHLVCFDVEDLPAFKLERHANRTMFSFISKTHRNIHRSTGRTIGRSTGRSIARKIQRPGKTVALSVLSALSIALGSSFSGALTHMPVAEAGTMNYGQCPDNVIVVARGSQQNDQIVRTQYNPQSPYISNGYEERNIRGMLLQLEQRHPGVMKNTMVLGLLPEYYAAAFPTPEVAEDGDELTAAEAAQRIAQILKHIPAHIVATTAIQGFQESYRNGLAGTVRAINDFEAETGCHSDYILVGYSQGTMVLGDAEHMLAERGQLAGVVHLGDPYRVPGVEGNFGYPRVGKGLLTYAPVIWPTTPPVEGVPRINYCIRDDIICDTSPTAAKISAHTVGGTHVHYFLDKFPAGEDDERVLDTLASWLQAKNVQ